MNHTSILSRTKIANHKEHILIEEMIEYFEKPRCLTS